jgi:hypothetical protein
VIRAQASNRPARNGRVPSPPDRPRRRLAARLAVQLLLLALTAACSAPGAGGANLAQGSGSAPAETASGASPAGAAPATGSGAQPAADPAADTAALAAKSLLEAALAGAVAGGSKPGTDQLRAAVAAAGFPPDRVETTAGRTPTGLAADTVEVAVQSGRNCVIAQLRNGSVTTGILPVLAGGGCLVGARGTH